MRSKCIVWVRDGRPRGDDFDSYREYKDAKICFRKLHRNVFLEYIQQVNNDIDNAAGIDRY